MYAAFVSVYTTYVSNYPGLVMIQSASLYTMVVICGHVKELSYTFLLNYIPVYIFYLSGTVCIYRLSVDIMMSGMG